MRSNFNRQRRREALCIASHTPCEPLATTAGWAMATAHRDDLALVAARIAAELELSPDAIDELLWGPAGPGPFVRTRAR